MKNTIDTIRQQCKNLGVSTTTQEIKQTAEQLEIDLNFATTEQKKMVTDKISNKLATVQKTEITLNDTQKTEIIQRQAEKLQITFTASEVTDISKSISNTFTSRQSLTKTVLNAIKKYAQWQADQDSLAIAETAQDIVNIQNRFDNQTVNALQNIANALKDNESQWQSASDEVLEMFKIPG